MAARVGTALRHQRNSPGAPSAPRRPAPQVRIADVPAGVPLRLPQAGGIDRLLLDRLRRGDTGIGAAQIVAAQSAHLRSGTPVIDHLCAAGAGRGMLLRLTAEAAGTGFLDQPFRADAGLIDRLGLRTSLSRNLAPLGRAGGAVVIATGHPSGALRHARLLRSRLGPFRLVLADPERVEAAVLSVREAAATSAAHLPRIGALSCHGLNRAAGARLLTGIGAALLAGMLVSPLGLLAVLTAVPVLLLIASTLLRLAALCAMVGRGSQGSGGLSAGAAPFRSCRQPPPGPRPFISLLVPLLREERIAERLVRRLEALRWPRERLEVCLIVEADDHMTLQALDRTELPSWMRVVTVPPGPVKTKPRALNYALQLARGSIIGVYDAEDAPDPGQLEQVVAGFEAAPPEMVCLQGALDFYNPRQSMLTRMFTMDYASWFRLVLPGLARLGLVLPLGGTTLFFRRRALEALGGWDAWNVTEDADLGIRLARRGWTTGLIPSTTHEEAISRVLPWIRQRSRWIKGYAMTWLTHMRQPVRLWRDLGPRRFFGLQVMVIGSVLQALMAPLLWSFWCLALFVPHPLMPLIGTYGLWTLVGLFLISEAVGMACVVVALRATGHRGLWRWVPAMHLYGWLATFAAWKAAAELAVAPFYWDKTGHGHSTAAAQPASILRASTRSLVS